MLNYTKGEWKAIHLDNTIATPNTWFISANKNIIAHMATGEGYPKNRKANALLISQAPALLEAVKRFLESSACTNGCSPDDMTCDTSFARKILSKLEGEK